MRCEVIAVGTELLLGQIVDSNSSWIGEQLALAGIDSLHQTKVGDNQGRIVDSLRLALSRADAVITCGGLGPTQDDITREAIAEVMGVSMERDDDMAAHIRQLFESRGRRMAGNNLRQADRPVGASPIAEMPGTAPGLVCPVGEKVIYAVPGVPSEMKAMLEGTVLPDLQRRSGQTAAIRSRVLRTWGNTESGLAELLAERIRELDALGNPTLAFQASGIEGLKVRITAKAADVATAQAQLDDEEARLRAILGDVVFGLDEETMESVALDALAAHGLTLAVAEPLSGGVLASRLTAFDGAAAVLRGALAVAADGASPLYDLPGESAGDAAARARAVAAAVRQTFGADLGIVALAARDVAGEGAHPNGTVFLALADGAGSRLAEVRLPGDRARQRQFSVISLLNFLRLELAQRGSGAGDPAERL